MYFRHFFSSEQVSKAIWGLVWEKFFLPEKDPKIGYFRNLKIEKLL